MVDLPMRTPRAGAVPNNLVMIRRGSVYWFDLPRDTGFLDVEAEQEANDEWEREEIYTPWSVPSEFLSDELRTP